MNAQAAYRKTFAGMRPGRGWLFAQPSWPTGAGFAALGSAVAGALAMYLLDRDAGRRRRAHLRDGAQHLWLTARLAVGATARDVAHRAKGTASRLSLQGEQEVSDELLDKRVRARLGRAVRHPHALTVQVREGVVTLGGPVLADESEGLLRTVWDVRGVRDVRDRLEVHTHRSHAPALQGEGVSPTFRREWRRTHWPPAWRLAGGAAGALVTAAGLSRGGRAGRLAALAGTALLLRAATKGPASALFGLGRWRRSIEIQKGIHIDAPVEKLFAFFDDPENYSRIMSHVREVRRLDKGRSRWVLAAPAGLSLTWEAVQTERVPGRHLAWRSVPGSLVGHSTTLRFVPDGGGTRVYLHVRFALPGGLLGEVVAHLLGLAPKRLLEEDLQRLKTLMEVGKTSIRGEVVIDETIGSPPPTLQ